MEGEGEIREGEKATRKQGRLRAVAVSKRVGRAASVRPVAVQLGTGEGGWAETARSALQSLTLGPSAPVDCTGAPVRGRAQAGLPAAAVSGRCPLTNRERGLEVMEAVGWRGHCQAMGLVPSLDRESRIAAASQEHRCSSR